jgi:hypothetical protein
VCRKVAGAELSALVTFGVISSTQSARVIIYKSIVEKEIGCVYICFALTGQQQEEGAAAQYGCRCQILR